MLNASSFGARSRRIENDDDFHTGDFPVPPLLGGGRYTNAGDMIRIFDSLYNGTLLSNESLDRFSTFTTEDENTPMVGV